MLAHRLETIQDLYSRIVSSTTTETPSPPRCITDGNRRAIQIRTADHEFGSLVDLYASFDPAQRAQGTPPREESAIRDWLETVLDGISLVAWHEHRAVGHVMFVPDADGSHELAIFVHQDYQRAGIGSELLKSGLDYAESQGVTHVWLTVASSKGGVQKLYSDFGFTMDAPIGPTRRMSQRL